MLYSTVGLGVAAMVVCALVKGFTARRMGELKRELSSFKIEEGRAKEERGCIEIRLESAEARNNNVTFEIEKGGKELEDLENLVAELETKLKRAEPEEGEE